MTTSTEPSANARERLGAGLDELAALEHARALPRSTRHSSSNGSEMSAKTTRPAPRSSAPNATSPLPQPTSSSVSPPSKLGVVEDPVARAAELLDHPCLELGIAARAPPPQPGSPAILRHRSRPSATRISSCVGEPPGLVLGEDDLAVADHVELALGAGDVRRLDAVGLQLGRETRGPLVVARSGRAVVDLDRHGAQRTRRREGSAGGTVGAARLGPVASVRPRPWRRSERPADRAVREGQPRLREALEPLPDALSRQSQTPVGNALWSRAHCSSVKVDRRSRSGAAASART